MRTALTNVMLVVISIAAAGCAVGPEHKLPEVELPATFEGASLGGWGEGPVAAADWWTVLGDPLLDELVGRAVAHNRDLRLAASRVREARATAGTVGSGLLPRADTAGGYSRSYGSENATPGGAGPIQAAPLNFGQGGRALDLFQAGFDAGWEVDVFGAVRRGLEAADADIGAAVEDRRAVMVSVIAETVTAYVELRGLQSREAIAADNVAAQQDVVALTRTRLDGGVGTELEVRQAESLLRSLQAEIPELQAVARRQALRLGVLTGGMPAGLTTTLARNATLPIPPGTRAGAGVPSDLLRRRPDVRRAERELASATARIGVAVADLLPRFSITGSFGVQSSGAGDLFRGGSLFGTIGPAVRWPIFDAGRRLAEVRVRDERARQAAVRWESAVVSAVEEVEGSLTDVERRRERVRLLEQAVAADRAAAGLADDRWQRGVADFLPVLDARRTLYGSLDRLTSARQAELVAWVRLYKSLGGGWEVARDEP